MADLLYTAGMRIRAVLFDFGGTLDGPGRHWLDRFVDLYDRAGLDLAFEQVRAAFDHATACAYRDPRVRHFGLEQTVAFHVERHMQHLGIADAALAERTVAAFVDRARIDLAASRVLLERLHSRVALGVISNFYGNLQHLLEEADLAALMTTVLDSNRVGLSKPDPEIFRRAVREVGCSPAEALYVGDSFEKDVVGAHEAGLHTAWLIGHEQQACRAPDMVDVRLRRLEDLEEIVE
jgi:putative hydrolase of the HAD superfamily